MILHSVCESPSVPLPAATSTAVRSLLQAWYSLNKRDLPWRRTSDPYAIWISEIMLQQTQVQTAEAYFRKFLEFFPDATALAKTDLQLVLRAWQGLGYYSRARNLHRCAKELVGRFGGILPDRWEDLRRLPGFGDYTTAAVLSIAYSQPYAAVDGNVRRVLARLLSIESAVDSSAAGVLFQKAADQLLDLRNPGNFNQAMMELGALVCTPRSPLCVQCPIKAHCLALKSGLADELPRRSPRAAAPLQRLVVGAVRRNGRILIVKRPDYGLLGGMWEMPGGRAQSDENASEACLRLIKDAVGLDVTPVSRIVDIKHAYTHFKIHMEVILCDWRKGRVKCNGPAAAEWILPDQIGRFPVHGAVQKAWPRIRDVLKGNIRKRRVAKRKESVNVLGEKKN